ncbi:MAG: DegT/DnrJ/EryC1/StrS family aminotransferase [Kiritimatiellae bacterium]|nr:DegT/DnrJ/EryC1/StrS family aminotransferase [Kiritimatiellia bacterium]
MPATAPRLAVDGGEKVFPGPLPQWPAFAPETDAAVLGILHSGRVNYWTGDAGRRFEEAWAQWLGVRNAVSVSSGTAALHVALAALGIGSGDEVICTPYSFISSASCVLEAGALPVFADTGTDHLLDPAKIEGAITPRTRAIVVVHLYGMVADMDRIMEIARRRGIAVVEDCAQCVGGLHRGRKAGTVGDIGCFSFCQAKHFTTGGEGGMVCCNDDGLAWACRSLRDHGCDARLRFGEKRQANGGSKVAFERIGYNFRLTEIQSAIGLGELARLDSWNLPRRRELAGMLMDGLSGHPLVRHAPIDTEERRSSFWLVPFALDTGRFRDGIDIHQFVRAVQAEGAGAYGIYWPPMFREEVFALSRGFGRRGYPFRDPAFDGGIDYAAANCPVALALIDSTIGFWVHPTYGPEHISAAIDAFDKVAAAYSA